MIQNRFEPTKTEARIIGFYSTRHRGVFTPNDSNLHIRFQTPDNDKSADIQAIEIGDGAKLRLPAS
jgi:acetolactate decarboxylase